MKTKTSKEPSQQDERLQRWASKIKDGMQALAEMQKWLCGPPDGVEPSDLPRLLDVRALFLVNDLDNRPVSEAATRFASRMAARKDDLGDAALETLVAVERGIAGLLDQGATDARIVRTKDFAVLRTVEIPTPTQVIVLHGGVLDSLPKGHALREVLPAADCYQVDCPHNSDVGRPVMLLGLPQSMMDGQTGTPRAFYVRETALYWTKTMRNHQRQKFREQEEERRREEVEQRRRFWASPTGQEELRRQALEQMRATGRIPEFVEAAPTIRVGR